MNFTRLSFTCSSVRTRRFTTLAKIFPELLFDCKRTSIQRISLELLKNIPSRLVISLLHWSSRSFKKLYLINFVRTFSSTFFSSSHQIIFVFQITTWLIDQLTDQVPTCARQKKNSMIIMNIFIFLKTIWYGICSFYLPLKWCMF